MTEQKRGTASGRTPRALAFALTMLLAFFGVAVQTPSSASASVAGIYNSKLLLNGASYDGTPVVKEGDVLTLRFQYNQQAKGQDYTVAFGDNLILQPGSVPAGNTAVESISAAGDAFTVHFKGADWPADINQGVFDLQFKVMPAGEGSGFQEVIWSINGEQQPPVTVIVKKDGDEFQNVTDGQSKSGPGTLSGYVTVANGVVTLDPSIANVSRTYTLNYSTTQAKPGLAISDLLPTGMDYVAGSFSAQLTSWDADGLNKKVEQIPFAPVFSTTAGRNGFSATQDLAANTRLAITYTAKITDVAAVQAQLQQAYDALGANSGAFSIALNNTAEFDGTQSSAGFAVTGTKPGPTNPGTSGEPSASSAFVKSGSYLGTDNPKSANVETDQNGKLKTPVDVSYTFDANLNAFAASDTLKSNVVITDVLPDQLIWQSDADGFISAKDKKTGASLALTALANCPSASDFAGDAYAGTYCVNGQTLSVNVGKDTALDVRVTALARLVSIAGLPKGGSTTVQDATAYLLRNTAAFAYNGKSYSSNADLTVVDLPDTSGGIIDSTVFQKTGTTTDPVVQPGQRGTVKYTLRAKAASGKALADLTMVDHVDRTIFDLGEQLSRVTVSSSYAGISLQAGTDFSTVLESRGLAFALTPAGLQKVDTAGAGDWLVLLTLQTFPLQAQQTLQITNTATLYGKDDVPTYWTVDADREITSYGDEAEVRKELFDAQGNHGEGAWVTELPVGTDASGKLSQDVFVYRVEIIPHGNYTDVPLVSVEDVLPAGVDFLGFIGADDVAKNDLGSIASTADVDISQGNFVASYLDGTVTIAQQDGTVIPANAANTRIPLYFAVKVKDPKSQERIVNQIGGASATIIPVGLGTTADGSKLGSAGGTVVDAVAYHGLTPGQKYTLRGEMMERVTDASSGEVTAAPTGITAEKTFTAEHADGSVNVEFVVPKGYQGKSLTVFEYLFAADAAQGEPAVAEHADINAVEQTVEVPRAQPTEPGDKTPPVKPGDKTPTKPGDRTPTQPGERTPDQSGEGLPETGGNGAMPLALAGAGLLLLGGGAVAVARRRRARN